MAMYNTIAYTREAVQLEVPDTPSSIPPSIAVDGDDIPVYRDTQGLYLLINTKFGRQRANEGQWAVLMSAKVPASPEVPGVQAVGSYTVAGVATGDGPVGFSYNGVNYTVSPTAGQTADNTASALALVINGTPELTAIAVGPVITISAGPAFLGTGGNLPLVDISTDTVQDGTPIGLSGGVDYVPGTPEVLAVFEIYNDGDFQLVYEPTP